MDVKYTYKRTYQFSGYPEITIIINNVHASFETKLKIDRESEIFDWFIDEVSNIKSCQPTTITI